MTRIPDWKRPWRKTLSPIMLATFAVQPVIVYQPIAECAQYGPRKWCWSIQKLLPNNIGDKSFTSTLLWSVSIVPCLHSLHSVIIHSEFLSHWRNHSMTLQAVFVCMCLCVSMWTDKAVDWGHIGVVVIASQARICWTSTYLITPRRKAFVTSPAVTNIHLQYQVFALTANTDYFISNSRIWFSLKSVSKLIQTTDAVLLCFEIVGYRWVSGRASDC